eukprot:11228323-Lingulodinium_polyedra.AAC.3
MEQRRRLGRAACLPPTAAQGIPRQVTTLSKTQARCTRSCHRTTSPVSPMTAVCEMTFILHRHCRSWNTDGLTCSLERVSKCAYQHVHCSLVTANATTAPSTPAHEALGLALTQPWTR